MTKDTEKAFKIIYCEYKSRRKKGFTKDDSVGFEDGEVQNLDSFSNWLRQDIESAINELLTNKFIKKNIIGDITITDYGIQYMEAKPKEYFNDLKSLFDIVSILI